MIKFITKIINKPITEPYISILKHYFWWPWNKNQLWWISLRIL